MMITEPELFDITLYVPDRTAKAFDGDVALQSIVLDGSEELDFLWPAWWEGSHTARLGLIRAGAGPPPDPDGGPQRSDSDRA